MIGQCYIDVAIVRGYIAFCEVSFLSYSVGCRCFQIPEGPKPSKVPLASIDGEHYVNSRAKRLILRYHLTVCISYPVISSWALFNRSLRSGNRYGPGNRYAYYMQYIFNGRLKWLGVWRAGPMAHQVALPYEDCPNFRDR